MPFNDLFCPAFVNNGVLETGVNGRLTLDVAGFVAGAGSTILLNGGDLWLSGSPIAGSNEVTITTAQIYAFYADSNVVTSGAYGFGLGADTTLNNAAATLTLGAGTVLGTLVAAEGPTVINGGTVDDENGTITGVALLLQNLTLESATAVETLDLGGIGNPASTLSNVTIAGASTVDVVGSATLVGSLIGVSNVSVGDGTDIDSVLTLNGVAINEVQRSGGVTISCVGTGSELNLNSGQSIDGYTIDFVSNYDDLSLASNVAWNDATFNVSGSAIIESQSSSASPTFGSALSVNVAAGASLELVTGYSGSTSTTFATEGTITSAGTLALFSEPDIPIFLNTGTIDITSGGTLLAQDLLQATDCQVINRGEIALNGANSVAIFSYAISGPGTIALNGASDAVAFGNDVGGGQLVEFSGSQETMAFTTLAAATYFAGRVGGFALGDTLEYVGETLTAARFDGGSISVTLSTGTTVWLRTTTDLSGALTVSNSHGVGTVTYGSTAAVLPDWGGIMLPAVGEEHTAAAGSIAVQDYNRAASLRLDWLPQSPHF